MGCAQARGGVVGVPAPAKGDAQPFGLVEFGGGQRARPIEAGQGQFLQNRRLVVGEERVQFLRHLLDLVALFVAEAEELLALAFECGDDFFADEHG
jgi:hypothetical protein